MGSRIRGRAGVTWALSDEVVAMGDRAWAARAQQLAALAGGGGGGGARVPRGGGHGPLRDWLEHQKGLLALGARGPLLSHSRMPVPMLRKRLRPASALRARSARAVSGVPPLLRRLLWAWCCLYGSGPRLFDVCAIWGLARPRERWRRRKACCSEWQPVRVAACPGFHVMSVAKWKG